MKSSAAFQVGCSPAILYHSSVRGFCCSIAKVMNVKLFILDIVRRLSDADSGARKKQDQRSDAQKNDHETASVTLGMCSLRGWFNGIRNPAPSSNVKAIINMSLKFASAICRFGSDAIRRTRDRSKGMPSTSIDILASESIV